MAEHAELETVLDHELMYDESPLRSTLLRRDERPEELVREGDLLAGKYRVERIPGRSGLGVLVHVRHMELGQEVTLKFLVPEACAYPEFVQRFVREARAAVRIQGEHVARITDVGRLASGAPYMVREYLRGPDLAEVLKVRGPLPVAEAVDYIVQACEGVAEGHMLGVVHRNIRPTSLVVARRSDGAPLVKVFDFAASESLHVDPFTERAVSLVGTSAIMASLPYLAPEQIRDPHDVDYRADVYALGAVLFELVAGSPVYAADTAPALVAQVAADPAPSLRSLRPDAPSDLDHVVLRCLAKNRAIRYPSMGELVSALAPFASAESVGSIERVLRLARQSTSPRAAAPSSAPRSLTGPLSTRQAPSVTRTQPLILRDDETVTQPLHSYEPLIGERVRRTPATPATEPAQTAAEEGGLPRASQPPPLQEPPLLQTPAPRRSVPPVLPGSAAPAVVAPQVAIAPTPSSGIRAEGAQNVPVHAAPHAVPHRAPALSQTADTMMPPPRSSMPGGLSRSWIPEAENTGMSKARAHRLTGVGAIAAIGTLAAVVAIGSVRGLAPVTPVAAGKAAPATVAPAPPPQRVARATPEPPALAAPSAAAAPITPQPAAIASAVAPKRPRALVATAPARKEAPATHPAAEIAQRPDLFDSPD